MCIRDSTKATLESVQKELETINQQISDREAEINYLTTTINNLQANIEKNNQISVSYTHLDVYKRQGLYIGNSYSNLTIAGFK